ncbi:hypothetical protein HZH68_004313 [Vespula germanica]|uniref:Uncharacterized protein n=2 Tax=Vespula TaxID=7451 RepID=A0A834KPY7_VESGE|nr:hypothetical protein HZH68_004313 [Vespula germanica]
MTKVGGTKTEDKGESDHKLSGNRRSLSSDATLHGIRTHSRIYFWFRESIFVVMPPARPSLKRKSKAERKENLAMIS